MKHEYVTPSTATISDTICKFKWRKIRSLNASKVSLTNPRGFFELCLKDELPRVLSLKFTKVTEVKW